jgi:hypothetical protein
VQDRGQAERPALLWRGVSVFKGFSDRAIADVDRYVWFARKPAEASNYGHGNDPIHDEEILESDEEDRGSHPTHVTNVPLPSTTDATQASVDQLSALAVGADESKHESLVALVPESRSEPPLPLGQKDHSVQQAASKDVEEVISPQGELHTSDSIPSSKTGERPSRPTGQHEASSPRG